MNDDQIKIFLTVSETGSFSKAEARMHISKQAMLKQMNQLEEELAVRLFIRSRNGIVLSEAGQIFRKGMLKINRERDNLIKTCRKADGAANTIRVGNVEHQALLNPVTQAFMARYPGVQIRQVIHPNHSGEWRVENGIQDVAETFREAYEQSPKVFSYRALTTVPYVAAMRKGHPLSRKKTVSLSELSSCITLCFPVMLGEGHMFQVFRAFSDAPDRLICRDDVDNQVQAAYTCIDSDQVLITANPFIESISDLVKIPLENGWEREYGIIFREPVSPVVQNYIDTALEVYLGKS